MKLKGSIIFSSTLNLLLFIPQRLSAKLDEAKFAGIKYSD